MENFYENYLKNENEPNFQEKEEIPQENEEKKSKILFNEIIDDLIRKKASKDNMLKIQIEKNKKNLLEKFYSLSSNQTSQNINKDQKNIVAIPTNVNNPLIQEEQKEYDELREKYKNERNKKKSSIFKSEDLHISNTNSVHLKKEDYSPINPNVINQETKNNILIIQKKLFGDNEETSKVENIDEIDDLDFDDIDIKDFKSNNNNSNNNNNIININNENENDTINNNINNNNKISNSNSNINLANLDTNNINFELSSNIKSETNENNNDNNDNNNDNNNIILNEIETNYFSNEILKEIRAVEFTFFGTKKKSEKIKEYKKQINRTKNFSVQLVSKLDYYRGEEKDNNNVKDNNNINNSNKYKKRKIGSDNRDAMNDMNDFIKNLNLMNPNMNNNININNINNNININHANLAEIISQQPKLNPKKISSITKKPKINNINNVIKNSKKNSDHYLNLNNNINSLINNNYNTNTATTTNSTANKTNNISSSKKNNYSTNINNINSINNNPIISSKTPNSIINHKKPSYKKVILNNTKPILNNLDLNLNENIQNLQKVKTKAQIKINYRHISNSNLTQINSNSNNNSNKRKRKNNSVIINNSNKRKDPKINFYHFNTNSNNSNNNNINQNNLKNIISQIPSIYKNNPLTTKNKKISMVNIINNNKNSVINNNQITKKKNSYNNININSGNKFQTINTLQKNNLIKFYKPNHQIEAIHKIKQQNYLGIYFIYAEKIKDHFLFKGIYKKGVSDLHNICNKIYSGTSAPICINYEKYFIFLENNKMELIQTKLNSINALNSNKSIILVKSE